jgi:hypothetical protein
MDKNNGVYSIISTKQHASLEELGELKEGAFLATQGNYFFIFALQVVAINSSCSVKNLIPTLNWQEASF